VNCLRNLYNDQIEDFWVPSDRGPEHVPDDPRFGALQFTSDEGESVLQDLDVNKDSCSDGISPIILKNCAYAFAKPLSLLFNTLFILCSDIQERQVCQR
jgi:hypothetical protein